MKIYIACPTHVATGGTELLHQLCNQLMKLGQEAYMYYTGEYAGSPVEKRFASYHNNIALNIPDKPDVLLIVPETKVDLLYQYRRLQKAVWWLSVDNYYGAFKRKERPIKLLYHKLKNYRNQYLFRHCRHFVQSEYARLYLLKEQKVLSKDIQYLSDYINEVYIQSTMVTVEHREDNILYNPKKGYEFTKKLMEVIPEFHWIPLQNLTPDEMRNLMMRSKVYIDFGNHPGKDRIPREAALCGCCVITGLRGAAGNNFDVLIPRAYKFTDEDTQIDSIHKKITECMLHYDQCAIDFDDYRQMIRDEEERFVSNIKKIFLL